MGMHVKFVKRDWLCRDLLTPAAQAMRPKASGESSKKTAPPPSSVHSGDIQGVRRVSIASGGVVKEKTAGDAADSKGSPFPYAVIPLTPGNVVLAWEELLGIFRQFAPQLVSFPALYTPELVEGSRIQLRVKSTLEQEQIQRLVPKITVYLRGKFAMETLMFQVVHDPTAVPKRTLSTLSGTEYIQELARVNPVMSELFSYLKVKL